MGGQRRAGRRGTLTLAVLALQLAVCLVLLIVPLHSEPHRAPVTISGPAVVADSLARQVRERSGGPLDAGAVTTAREARADVEQGRAVAALAIDLRLNRATLFVSSAQGAALTDAVSRVVGAVAAPFAVDVTTQDVAPLPDGSAGQRGLKIAVAAAIAFGLVFAILVTWWRGPVADEWSHAALRIASAVGAAAITSLAIAVVAADQVGGSVLAWWGVLALAMLATSAATLALAAVLGVVGVGVATLVFSVSAAPLARIEHPLLLPAPWGQVTPWLPHGAGLDAARQVAWFDGAAFARPLAVLAAWLVVSCIALAVARRERRRAGVQWRSPATAP
ncbi:hypothetical protein [Aeromicrobium wangtongii]|uniref:hypothetical protein n=1 Tax=Aeromicrobium wangtongii TaxID=2969247 RepID=UPI002016CF4F|nr:hypothetical protein [Aeromicrobium wangtongii]MCL3818524.1 hypothetical protein [Aeromicrobium wangtongii]